MIASICLRALFTASSLPVTVSSRLASSKSILAFVSSRIFLIIAPLLPTMKRAMNESHGVCHEHRPRGASCVDCFVLLTLSLLPRPPLLSRLPLLSRSGVEEGVGFGALFRGLFAWVSHSLISAIACQEALQIDCDFRSTRMRRSRSDYTTFSAFCKAWEDSVCGVACIRATPAVSFSCYRSRSRNTINTLLQAL
jgi:hypothetical protein